MESSCPGAGFSSVQFSHSVVSESLRPHELQHTRSPPKLMPIVSVMPSNHLILCRPLLLLPSIFPSIRVFSNESALHIRWPKYWSFSFNISPSNEHPGLISFRMDWQVSLCCVKEASLGKMHKLRERGKKRKRVRQRLAV